MKILDACCGSKLFWFDKDNEYATYMDVREEKFEIHGKKVNVKPDVVADFRKMPFEDNTYDLIVFDPPHLKWAGKSSIMRAQYGQLDKDNWPDDISRGMDECMRVLKPTGTLIFKWNEAQVPLKDVLKAISYRPLFGNKRSKTHWLTFMKEEINMTKTVEFRPIIKTVKMNKGGKQEIILTIENGSLDGKFESVNQLIGEAVNVVIQPSVIGYRIPYDIENDAPYLKYVVNGEGVVVEVKEEQLAIDGVNNTSYKDYIVEMDDVDNFIKQAPSLTLPPNIELNPRTILEYLDDAMTYEEIAEEMETKEVNVVNDLDKARQYFAPYAAAWAEYNK